jgi:hypothetical protein
MIPTFAIDLTTMLAPFAHGAAGFVTAGLAVIIVRVIRAERSESATSRTTTEPASRDRLAA